MEMNEILDKLPKHLMSLVIDQPYNEYSPQDHAVWRYVMRQNVRYLSKVAHGSYLEGLKKTGISVDQIPHMYGMNRILKEIGWAAVSVDGFIPPSAFMEFQAYKVLVIAADIRPIDQIEYTPAPDIIHEAAGHAPIIAHPDYSEYLRYFGWLGSKAFSSAKDYEIYEAIRHLSILKADPYVSESDIRKAEEELANIEAIVGPPSEMTRIRNLHWWTVEYGLIGDLKSPKIYGAGLLSSIGESYSALNNGVKKLPYTLDAVNTDFDITTKQPQLFVTPTFEHLTEVLEEFADTMALRTGGVDALLKAIESNNTATCVYSSGMQVSGTVNEVIIHMEKPAYFRTTGPSTLNYKDHELPGQGKEYHRDGFGSPVGKLRDISTPLEKMTDAELNQHGIAKGKRINLEFESGVRVQGFLNSLLRKDGNLLMMSFSDCKVSFRERILFQPEWGTYDMAIGESIVSAFSGPVDPDSFGLSYPVPVEKTHKIFHSEEAKRLHTLYQKIRNLRETKNWDTDSLKTILNTIEKEFPAEWLLPMEILELVSGKNTALDKEIRELLLRKKEENPQLEKLIDNGLLLIH